MRAAVTLFAVVAALSPATCTSAAKPPSPPTTDLEQQAVTRIHIVVGEATLKATLDDTRAARDFASLLPLELSLSDYHAVEKVADLPRPLDTSAAPPAYAASAGDITTYAPWGNLAIFYKPFRSASGLVRLGELDDPIDPLLRGGAVRVRIEVARP